MRLIRSISLFVLVGICCFCQPQKRIDSEEPKETNTTDTLVFNSGIRSILEDSKGNIWFGSDKEGVALIQNGFINYFSQTSGLSDNQIRNIYEDETGQIWFEGGQGLSVYNWLRIMGRTDREYNSDEFVVGEGDLWFKGNEMIGFNSKEGGPGVYQFNGNEIIFRPFPVEPKEGYENYYSVTTPFIQSTSGAVWFGTYGAAVKLENEEFHILDNETFKLNDDTGYLHIRSIFEDDQGNIWIGNNGSSVLKTDGDEVVYFTKEHELYKDQTGGNSLDKVFAISQDTAGNMWFGTSGSGVWRYDGESFVNYTKKDGIPSDHIWTIYRSKEGEMWFGGASPSGVYVFTDEKFEKKF